MSVVIGITVSQASFKKVTGQSPVSTEPEVSWKTLGRLAFRPSNPPDEVKHVLNEPIQVVGFMVAGEFNSDRVSEFILMPISRGCIHVPPPPPSAMIHVKMKASGSTPLLMGAARVHGVLSLARDSGGEDFYSYEMLADRVEAASSPTDHFKWSMQGIKTYRPVYADRQRGLRKILAME